MGASLSGVFSVQQFTDMGAPLVGGRLYTFSPSTTTLKIAYTDAAATIPHQYTFDGSGSQYIALDSRGELPSPLFLASGGYDLRLCRADGTTVWTRRAEAVTAGSDALRADLAASASGAGLVAYNSSRTVRDVLADVVNVRNYGATGNGSTDDYAAIMSAIAALPAAGGEVFFPGGQYVCGNTITFGTRRVTLRGCGSSEVNNVSGGTTLIKAATLNGPLIRMNWMNGTVRDMTLQGRSGNGGDGISIESTRCRVKNVAVFGMGNDGIRIGTDAGTNANCWRLDDVKSKSNGRHGLTLSDKLATSPGLADANGGTLVNADLQSNGQHGCLIENAQLNTFVGMVCQNNGARGLSVGGSGQHNTFSGGDWEGNSADEMHFDAGSIGNCVSGGTISGSWADDGNNSFFGLSLYTSTGVYQGLITKLPNKSSTIPTVLDWYEEKDFTSDIAVSGSTTAGTATFTARKGLATRIGNLCSFTLRAAWSAHTGTGGIVIGGLPWTISAAAENVPITITANNLTFTGQLAASAVPGAKTVYVVSLTSNAASAFVAMDTAADIYISGTYPIDGA